jgi:hypothetical protein
LHLLLRSGHGGANYKKPDFAQKSGFFFGFATFYNGFLEIVAILGKVSETGSVITARHPLQ